MTSPRRSRQGLAVAMLCFALAWAPPVRADDATEAQLQYELGAQLYKQGQYTDALQHFVASQRLVPNANVVLNIVQTFEFLKRWEEAYNWNETYIALAGGDAQAAGIARREKLEKQVAVVNVTTTPPNAELFVDRRDLGSLGRSPRRIAVTPGVRRVLASLPGYAEASAEVETARGKVKPVDLTLNPLVGKVQVATVPAGARVLDDTTGAQLAVAPSEVSLPVGEHQLRVELPGYVSQTKTVRVTEQQPVVLNLTLERAASSVSVLTVRGNVPGATVLLNGRALGRAPLSVPGLPPGTVQIEVAAPGHDGWSDSLTLEPGAATRVDYSLADPSERTWPGWRWIGYGTGGALLVAGGITGASALSARKDFDAEPSRERLDTVNSRNLTADILLGSGAAVIVGTLIWDLLRAPDAQSSARLTVER